LKNHSIREELEEEIREQKKIASQEYKQIFAKKKDIQSSIRSSFKDQLVLKRELSQYRQNQLEESYFRKNERIRGKIQDRLQHIMELEQYEQQYMTKLQQTIMVQNDISKQYLKVTG
jgi:hypothetical protein